MSSAKKPAVTLLEGRHITAADKRNILGGIDWLRENFAASVAALPDQTPDYGATWIRRGKSSKRYSIVPAEGAGCYRVIIRENYRNDWGKWSESNQTVLVRVTNQDPLYMPASAGS